MRKQLVANFVLIARFVNNVLWWLTFGAVPYVLNKMYKRVVSPDVGKLKQQGVIIKTNDIKYTEFANQLIANIESDFIDKQLIEMARDQSASGFVKDIGPALSKHLKTQIIEFALSDRSLGAVSSYLNFLPRLSSIKVMLNGPSSNAKRGSQLWHRDGMVHKGMNVFIAASHIGPEAGMYSAIPFSCVKREEVILSEYGKSGWDQDRISEDEMKSIVAEDDVINFIGEAGAYAMVDNGWIYHKGGFLESGYRLMIEISFQSSARNIKALEEPVCSLWDLDYELTSKNLKLNWIQKYSLRGIKSQSVIGHLFYKIDRYLVNKRVAKIVET